MTKVRKQKRRKKYRYNVNRKKLKIKKRKLPSIPCSQVKKAWEEKRTIEQNLNDMGLVYDTNKTFKIPDAKDLAQPLVIVEESGNSDVEMSVPSKHYVAKALEEDARTPRVKKFRLPNNQVMWLTYLMDKYGEDYKAMSRDPKNHYQETWKQIRGKMKRFKSIPEQYGAYLKSRKQQTSAESVMNS